MKLLPLLFIIFSRFCFGQNFEAFWNDQFHKELHVTCSYEDNFCDAICGSLNYCVLEENKCRGCIGTSLPMHHIFSELGRSIRASKDPVSRESILLFI